MWLVRSAWAKPALVSTRVLLVMSTLTIGAAAPLGALHAATRAAASTAAHVRERSLLAVMMAVAAAVRLTPEPEQRQPPWAPVGAGRVPGDAWIPLQWQRETLARVCLKGCTLGRSPACSCNRVQSGAQRPKARLSSFHVINS